MNYEPEIKYNTRDLHSAHCIAYPEQKMTYDKFKVIFRALGEAIMWYILEGFTFEFPYRLGTLRITKRKLNLNSKRKKIDFLLTKKYGKTIYHLNEHSDGFFYRFQWRRGPIKNIYKYSFQPLRIYKRQLAELIKAHQRDYQS